MIDLRSDTVTRPTPAMRDVIANAPVGDDVFGDDPSVNSLQECAADLLGMEAGLFVPSGTQSNLIALMAHCGRGDEYIVGQHAHTYKYEGGGAAVLGSIQPQPLQFEADGTLDLKKVEQYIKPDDAHFARTRLLCLENTQGGKALPSSYLASAREFVDEHGLALHLDGARVFNAAVEHGLPVGEVTRHFDSVSICLSKGLGSPLGSVLCGSREFVDSAHKWRKMVGGGMRQAGMMAAAGQFALENHVDRLAEDHEHAKILAEGLSKIAGIQVSPSQTNMVFFSLAASECAGLEAFARERQILMKCSKDTRLVMHLDVSRSDVDRVIDVIGAYFQERD